MLKENDLIESLDKIRENIGNRIYNYSVNSIRNKNKELSFVYFIYNEDTKLTKIGCTKNIIQRFKTIDRTFRTTIGINPKLKIERLMLCSGDSHKKKEKIIHNDFKCYRTYGEWFDLSKAEYLNEILNCGEVKYIDDIIIQDGDYFLDICKGYSRFDKEPEMYDINDYEYLLYLIKNNDDNEYFHNYIVKPYSKIEKYINSLHKNIVLLNE